MTPPIELRQRSPLGAPYRTPLGVLGPGSPPLQQPEWTATVDFETTSSFSNPPFWESGVSWLESGNNGCGSAASFGDDDWPYATTNALAFDLFYTGQSGVVRLDTDAANWRSWRITGDTSGMFVDFGEEPMTAHCTKRFAGGEPTDSDGDWSVDGATKQPEGFRPRLSESITMFISGQTFNMRRWENDGVPFGFIQGESCTVTLKP